MDIDINVSEKITNMKVQLETICSKLLKYTFTCNEYNVIDTFISCISHKKITVTKYYEIINLFIQKYSKIKPEIVNHITVSKIQRKCGNSDFEDILYESSDNFIRWIVK